MSEKITKWLNNSVVLHFEGKINYKALKSIIYYLLITSLIIKLQ